MLVALAATSAMAQVRVDVRLEKERYLAGEPVVVLVDMRNVGDEAVAYQGACSWDQRLEILGVAPRKPPNIFGCFSSTVPAGGCGAVDHPPMLDPGKVTTFRYLLKEYDLRAGNYRLSVSGNLRVGWRYHTTLPPPNLPPPSPARHKEGDPVEGAQFAATLSLKVLPAAERELRAAFAPLVSDANGANLQRRAFARAAIVESAPPFLETVIGRFAAEAYEYDTSAIDALGRLATPGSRAQLRNLLRTSGEAPRRAAILLALARAGHRDDADLFVSVLQDPTIDNGSRQYAALGLGRIGGVRAVRHLERALVAASPEVRPSIATALGNTRSAAAVPVLIGMYSSTPGQDGVCSGLKTLTHRDWCDGSVDDPKATRRQWLRAWKGSRSKGPIFGPDSCPVDPVAPSVPVPDVAPVRRATSSPRIASVVPASATPGSFLTVSGYALGLEDVRSVRVLFRQGDRERAATIGSVSSGGDPDNAVQHMAVVVPVDLIQGSWQIVIDANGRTSAAADVVITNTVTPTLAGIFPRAAHPAQFVLLTTSTPPQIDDGVKLTDARGREWRLSPGVAPSGVGFSLPDDMADGLARVRLVRRVTGEERVSAPIDVLVTSAPLPLDPSAVEWMTPVPPGGWTELHRGLESGSEFELSRVDRVDVEFVQGRVRKVIRAIGPDHARLQVPARLKPGVTLVRTRTWIERTASEWSAPATYTVSAAR